MDKKTEKDIPSGAAQPKATKLHVNTKLAHSGRDGEKFHGMVNMPVHHASTILFPTVDELLAPVHDPSHDSRYGRWGTPSTFALQDSIALLEEGDHCLLTPSGMAGVSCALLAYAGKGDHVLIADTVYTPTRKMTSQFVTRMGIAVEFYDPKIGADIARLMRANTKVVFVENPGSLTFELQDLPAIAKIAHKQDCIVICDHTWGAGYYYKSLNLGADVAIQALTKYVSGASDFLMGAVTVKKEHFPALLHCWQMLGYSVGPDDVFLASRGLRSLSVRLERHSHNALIVAKWLEKRPEVEQIFYPALESSPDHALWKRDFTGAAALFGCLLKPVPFDRVKHMLDGLQLFGMGYSWGGFESLIVPCFPDQSRSATTWNSPSQLLRIHVGLEEPQDLIADLAKGFVRLQQAH